MMRIRRPFIWAIALSLLLHVSLLLGPRIELPDWSAPAPLTVDIQAPPPQPLSPPQPVRRPIQSAPKATPAAPIVTANQSSAPPLATPTEPAPLAQASETPPPPAAPIDNRPAFPGQFELVYTVYRGDQGMSVGRTTHKWRAANNQYLLTSSTEATGLFSLFFGGRYILTSRGELSANGLKPISFWIQRGQSGERTEYAEFDWEAKSLQYGKYDERRNVALVEGTQDQLSVFYQLALTAPHSGQFKLALTTGRKFNQYDYQMIGEETIETPLGQLKTQHLARVAQEAGSKSDVWLALDHHYLPVRIKFAPKGGEILDHVIAEMRVPE
ncbi:MAG: DUF3108 domain-containing protein [Hydrogenophilales bacterium]|nr:DUF3108 domain-containing protein [Hydrogenophilales bacterium]